MKSKKKFLLLGVGVMGALALGVGATSTFAWYTAQAQIGSKAVSTYDTITTVDVDDFHKTITGVTVTALEVKSFTVSAGTYTDDQSVSHAKKLELAYYDSTIATAPKLRTGNLDQAGTQFLPHATANAPQDTTHNALYATVNVVIGLKDGATFSDDSGNVYTRAYIIAQLTGQTIDVTFTASGRARVYITDASETVANSNPESTANAVTVSGASLSADATYDIKATASCYMFVWGGNREGASITNDDNGSITQGLAVSATASTGA